MLSSLLPSQETLQVVSLLHTPLWTEAAPLQLCPKSSGNTQVCNEYRHCSCLPPHLPSLLQRLSPPRSWPDTQLGWVAWGWADTKPLPGSIIIFINRHIRKWICIKLWYRLSVQYFHCTRHCRYKDVSDMVPTHLAWHLFEGIGHVTQHAYICEK